MTMLKGERRIVTAIENADAGENATQTAKEMLEYRLVWRGVVLSIFEMEPDESWGANGLEQAADKLRGARVRL
ncbi:MAG: hypothetical protein DWQ20_00840 [Actinobacteria bacterium]|nr:MAG: hypothetical protein DWQ20_00840 [Actinomycetota bacterium]